MPPKRNSEEVQAGPEPKKPKTNHGLSDAQVRKQNDSIATFEDISAFMRVRTIPSDLSLGDDHDHIIHAVFREENFSNVEYRLLIEPSARLATRLLYQGIPTLNTIVNRRDDFEVVLTHVKGEAKPVNAHSKRDSDRNRLVTTEERDNIEAALSRLSTWVTFTSLPGYGDTTWTLDNDPRRTSTEAPSNINHCPKRLGELEVATRSGDTAATLFHRARLSFALCHEVVHALFFLCNGGDMEQDPFFHGSLLGEVGLEFESRLYGGFFSEVSSDSEKSECRRHKYTEKRYSSLSGIPAIWDFPCQTLVTIYGPATLSRRDNVRDLMDDYDKAWRVPLGYFQKLFTRAFWDHDVQQRGMEALQPGKDLGYVFEGRSFADKEWKLLPVAKLTKQQQLKTVPAGYYTTKAGDIVPGTTMPAPASSATSASQALARSSRFKSRSERKP